MAIQAESVIRKGIAISYALKLYQRERVTLAKAAELSGPGLYDFMRVCKDNRIPVFDVSRANLVDGLKGLIPA